MLIMSILNYVYYCNLCFSSIEKTEVTVSANNHVKDRIKVLLLAYYRSGSTFTSELFKNHPDVFYM